jgi:hypothetical protein
MPIPNEAISVCWLATGPGCSANRAAAERGASAIIRAQRALHCRTCR